MTQDSDGCVGLQGHGTTLTYLGTFNPASRMAGGHIKGKVRDFVPKEGGRRGIFLPLYTHYSVVG